MRLRFAYARDTDAVVTVSGSDSTPSVETDARWFSGSPSEVTVVSGISAASPSTSHYVDFHISWSNPRAVGLITALELSCPAGVLCTVTGKRSGDADYTYALGGNAASQRTLALPGGRVRLSVFPAAGNDPLIGVRIRIYNDRNSTTWATSSTDLSVGELGAWSTVILPARIPHRRTRTYNSPRVWGNDGALAEYQFRERRSITIPVTGEPDTMQRAGLSGALDIETIEALVTAAGARCIIVPRDFGDGAAFDAEWAHRTMLFGVAEFSEIASLNRKWSETSITVHEVL